MSTDAPLGHEAPVLLRVTDLEVAYGEARALFGVSFDVAPRDRSRRSSAPTARVSRR